MSTVTPNLGLFKYNTSTDANSAFNINKALNNNWDIIDAAITGGSSRNIGEIVASTLPLTDAGLHLLDGSLIQGGGVYSAFVNYMVGLKTNYPDLFTTEASWQEANTNYGVCGKFVYDSTNNTVRLPKVTGIIEGTTDVSALGDLVEAGLPNITGSTEFGSINSVSYPTAITGANGAFYGSGSTQVADVGVNQVSGYNNKFNFNASRSSSIYGNSTTVQPQTIKAFYYIVIATLTKTAIQVDIDTIATDLNSKVSIGDLAEVQCVVETYQNGTSWYRVYSDGWCEQGGLSRGNVTLLKPFLNANYVITMANANTSSYTAGYHSKVSTGFTVNGNYAGQGNISNLSVDWQACGYII